jgi:hypothetical protein
MPWKGTDVLSLITRLGGLNMDKSWMIRSWKAFWEPTVIPEFRRFYSADRRFPISVLYPERLSFFYDLNRDMELNVEWHGDENGEFGIIREHLGASAQQGDELAQQVLLGKKDLSAFMQESFARNYADYRAIGEAGRTPRSKIGDRIIGEGRSALHVKRLVWYTPNGDYAGEWTSFIHARFSGQPKIFVSKVDPRAQQPMLWFFQNSCLDEETFTTILTSFQWLDEEFFRSLPAPAYG